MRFARLTVNYYEDPVIEAIGEEWPEVFALWPWLIVQCHDVSHCSTNPDGWRGMTRQRAQRHLMNPRCAMRDLWTALVEGELIEVDGNLDGKFRVRLFGYSKYQNPFGSRAERKWSATHSTSDTRAGKKVSKVPGEFRDGSEGVPHKRKEKKREEEYIVVSNDAATKISTKQIREVFDHWTTAFNKNKRTTLDQPRKTAIRRAIDLVGQPSALRCIDGYASDPWRHEATVRHEIATLFRNAAQIEAGLDKAESTAGTDPFAGAIR